ncbi:MAG: amidohydrolase [Actinomycetota bacterium]|nr:amidohydrolase [Actinomycetota bacterium]
MSVVNSVVMEAGGIESWPVPTGGIVQRDPDGTLTGLLQEQAQQFVLDQRLPDAVDHMAAALAAASDHYLTEGITSCQEAGIGTGLVGRSPRQLAAFQQARDDGRLKVRVTAMVAMESLHRLDGHVDDPEGIGLDLGLRTGLGDDRLRVGAVKIFADGSLIGRTAAMVDDFADAPGNRGYFQMDEGDLREAVIGAHRAGWQVAVHAIGDRAVSTVLDCYEEALALAPRANHRHRIEHCGICRPEDVARIAALGVIPVPQGRFVNEIGDGMAAALGPERTTWCYRQRSFLDAGVVLPASSDRPVVQGAPLLGIADMVNQRTGSGAAFNPAEALTPLEALRAYTLGSAVASFAEDRKGSITPGKLADLAVLDRDLTAIDPEGIAETRVLATYVGGEAAWERTSS